MIAGTRRRRDAGPAGDQHRGQPVHVRHGPARAAADHGRRSTTPARICSAIYHSHTRSAAYPSRTDVELAFFPDTLYLIVSLADRDAPEIRAFRLRRGAPEGEQIVEEAVEIA